MRRSQRKAKGRRGNHLWLPILSRQERPPLSENSIIPHAERVNYYETGQSNKRNGKNSTDSCSGCAYLAILTIFFGIWKFCFEREKEATTRYLNIIRELGNDSNSVRSGAVITMDAYLKRSEKNYQKHREQGIYVLVIHLAVEKSPLVRATTQEALVNLGVKDKEDIVVRKLVSSGRHLWEQEQQRGITPNAVIRGDPVSDNLQSITDTLINIFERKKTILSDLDMSKIYLTSYDYSLKEVKFMNVQLDEACLVRMNLEMVTMKECKLNGALLDEAILKNAYLAGAELKNAYLAGADLEGADLEGADLQDADLEGAKLGGANLEGAKLEGANLKNADLRAALLFSIDSKKFQSDLDKGTISEGFQQEFENNQISLSKNTTVSVEEKDHRWLINDKDNNQTYTVRKEEDQLNICKETKFDPTDIKKAENWDKAVFDDGIWEKLSSQKD